jgi:hypothetical protein
MNTIKIKKYKNHSHKFKKLPKKFLKTQKELYGGAGTKGSGIGKGLLTDSKPNGIAKPIGINPAYCIDIPFACEKPEDVATFNTSIGIVTDESTESVFIANEKMTTPNYDYNETIERNVVTEKSKDITDNKNNKYNIVIPSIAQMKRLSGWGPSKRFRIITILPEILKTNSVQTYIKFKYPIEGKEYTFCANGTKTDEEDTTKVYLPVIVHLDTPEVTKGKKINFQYNGKSYITVSQGEKTTCQISHIEIDYLSDVQQQTDKKELVTADFTSLKAELTRTVVGRVTGELAKKASNATGELAKKARNATAKAGYELTKGVGKVAIGTTVGLAKGIGSGLYRTVFSKSKDKTQSSIQPGSSGSSGSGSSGSSGSGSSGSGSSGTGSSGSSGSGSGSGSSGSGQSGSGSSGQSDSGDRGSSGQGGPGPQRTLTLLERELSEITRDLNPQQAKKLAQAVRVKVDAIINI